MSAAAFQSRHPGLVWSHSRPSEAVLIRAALLRPRFETILDACVEFGLERVRGEWNALAHDATPEVRRAEPQVSRILRHIAEGFADAQAGD